MSPSRILGISGSLRSGSHSDGILASMADMLPDNVAWSTLDIGELPHYNADLEASALPAAVLQARASVEAAAAVVLAVPEYNHGIPGVLKNTLDWLSRPVRASCMVGKPVFFVTQSAGALGGVRAQYQLRETLASMLCEMPPMKEMVVTHAGEKIRGGRIADEATAQFIEAQLLAFLDRYVLIGETA